MWESINDFSKRIDLSLRNYRGCIGVDRKSDMHPLNWHRQLNSGHLYYFYADGNKLFYGKAIVRGEPNALMIRKDDSECEQESEHDDVENYRGEFGMGGDWWKSRKQDDF